jgi:glycosyltransferase involved in cell wall biosynthesis
MRKVSVIVGVADDRVVPTDVLTGICEALRDFRDLRLEFVVVRQAPSTAVNMVSGDFVVMFDADGYDPADVKKVLLPLLEDRADVVLGNRFGRMSGSVTSAGERAANSFLTWVANQLFKLKIGDSQTGLRAFRREALGLRTPALRFEQVDISYRPEGW